MRLPVSLAAISALLLCCAGFCPRANSQTAKKNPDATVSGKVTIKGKPAPGVVVGLRSSQPAQFDPTFKATTDEEGKYRIADVPGGSYVIAPVAPSFVISEVNSSRGQTVVVTESENVEGFDFELVRGGVITGKVTDADGHPIIEERVSLSPADQGNQRGPVYSIMQGFQTDDRGVYRIFGVRPGRYKVSVGEGDEIYFRGVGRGRPSHPTTYYPDATDPAKASVVEIGEGAEATGIDLTLGQSVQGFAVSGRIVDGETGKPAANVSIGLERIVVIDANNTRSYGGGTSAQSGIQGEFRLEKLPPGKYAISLFPPPESDIRGERTAFEVVDQDLTGLVIKTSMGASVSGTVVLEGFRDNNVVAALAQAYVVAYIKNDAPNVSSSGRAGRLGPDGSFRVGGLQAGTALLSFETMNRVKGLTVARLERDGVVQPNGIQVQNAEHVTGIKLVVTYSNGSVRGVVKMENGTLPPNGRLVVELTKTGGDVRAGVRPAEADSRGHFLVEGLAAGSYEIRVTAFAPEWRRRPASAKQLVTVTDGATTDVLLSIDLSPPPGP
jgi:5-hydroxyisourate hydrolase-like protein (transthyretin family)